MSEINSCRSCKVRRESVLCRLKDEEADAFDETLKHFQYGKGQFIFQKGSFPKGLFCISSGKVKLTQTGSDGREQIVHLARPGDILGYRAVLSGDKYSCSAIAIESCDLCFIPKQIFLDTVRKNPELAFELLLLFSDKLKETENKITAIAQRPVKERIAQSLLLLRECYGYEEDGKTINVSVTREEIANITGTTRETAIRVLFEMSNENVISLNGKRITILDAKRLWDFAAIND